MENSDSLQLKPFPDYYTVIPDISLPSSKSNGLLRKKVINAVLPLFYEAAHSAAMILHGLNIVIITTHFLNPGQMTVVCFD